MAFNPSPKVAVARDAANKFGKSHIIILMIDDKDGTLEYASYGENSQKCSSAKKLADIAYNALMNHISKSGL